MSYIAYELAKVDGQTGEKVWAKSSSISGTYVWDCAVDSQDNLILIGTTEDSLSPTSVTAGEDDVFVMKLDPDGNQAWVYQDGTAYADGVFGVAIDSEDNVYVAGGDGVIYEDIRANYSTTRNKLDGWSGREIWRHEGFAPCGDDCVYRAVALDESAGVAVAVGLTTGIWAEGETYMGGDADFAATALNLSTGEELGRWQGGTSEYDRMEATAFDSSGSLFMAGLSDGDWSDAQQGRGDFIAVKLGHPEAAGDGWGGVNLIIADCAATVAAVTCGLLACESRSVGGSHLLLLSFGLILRAMQPRPRGFREGRPVRSLPPPPQQAAVPR